MELRIYSVAGARAGALGPHPDSIPFPEHKHLSSISPHCWVYVHSHVQKHLFCRGYFQGAISHLRTEEELSGTWGARTGWRKKGRVAKWYRLGQGAVEQGLGRRGPEIPARSLGRPAAGLRLAMVSSTFSMKAFDEMCRTSAEKDTSETLVHFTSEEENFNYFLRSSNP